MSNTILKKVRLASVIVILGILAFSCFVSATIHERSTTVLTVSTARASSMQIDLESQVLNPAMNYLYINYNESIGLNPESSGSTDLNNTYWVYSDNYLASLVLSTYDPTNYTLTSRASNIKDNMTSYLNGTVPVNQYMVFDETVFNFNASNPGGTLLAAIGDAEIKTHQNNLSGQLGTWEYADIAFLEVIYYYKVGDWGNALRAYTDGIEFWDGKGLADRAFNMSGQYQTYKLALYIYASKLLGLPYVQQAFDTLLAMQQLDGGFRTGYNSSLAPKGFTNTETTSLAVLALIAPQQEPIPEFGTMPLVVILFVMTIVLMTWARRRKE